MGTLLAEGTGAFILGLRFFLHYGFSPGKSAWYGVFHAVSAFCNAGFDIIGNFSSFTDYSSDWIVCMTLMTLIVLGGLGFLVWDELFRKKFRFSRCSLHTKIVGSATLILLVFPAVLFFFLEKGASHEGMTVSQGILASLFDSVTPRTAGMNITDTASLSPAGTLLTLVLMFIGGSPSSTAGGIKTTTVAVLILFAFATIRNSRFTGAFGRRIPDTCIKKAISVFLVNLSLVLCGILLICAVQPQLTFQRIVFECFSAIGTVGMSAGITRDLGSFAKIVIMLLMYCGRVGSISFGAALVEKKAPPPVIAPYETITIG